MNKSLKPLALTTAGLSFFYAALYLLADILVFGTIFNEEALYDIEGIFVIIGILNVILFLVMLTLGIILTIFTAKLPKDTPGKVFLLIASIMTIAGFVVGLLNVVRTIYLIVSGVFFIVGAVKYGKSNEQLQQDDFQQNYFQ